MVGHRRNSLSVDQSCFYKLSSRSRLAKILKIPLSDLRYFEKHCSDMYSEWDTDDAKPRHIENPKYKLKMAQKRTASLLGRIEVPEFVHCPVKGRSAISNAKVHIGHREIRKLDIKTFFQSAVSQRVFWFFETIMRCPRDIAGLLTTILTFNGHLATGSPVSPILSYFSYQDLWDNLYNFTTSRGCVMTLYADDITISGDKVPGDLVWEMKKLIKRYGLNYHKEKRYLNQSAEVTGVIVHQNRTKAPHRHHKKLYQLKACLRKETDLEGRDSLKNKIRSSENHIMRATQSQ